VSEDKRKGTRFKVQDLVKNVNSSESFQKIDCMSKELEDRFHNWGKRIRDFCLKLKWDIINTEYIRQLIRSSGSVGANYIEASDDLGKTDEKMKIKISRRESKESIH